jgi:PAS domain S-box-containing protein
MPDEVKPIKASEERYRSLIEASLDPLVTISTEGKITDMNQATVNITGISREKITGTDFFEYFTEPQNAREVYQEVFAKGSVADSPLTLRHKNGKLTDVLFNGSVYKDDKGQVLGVVIVARDVTAQKRFENELIEAKQIAEAAVKSKQQFLSNMSHEIRTPMNAIIGFTKVMLKTELSEKQKEYLNAIKISGDALIVLINDILDLAKVDAGKMTFNNIPFQMSVSISAMLHLFEPKIQEKNLKLEKEYDPSIPDYLMGDPVRLNQIILNLVGNAVKFTATGKITVSVRKVREDIEKVGVEFSVSDTGIGIPAENLAHIFDDFQQANSTTSRLYGGTGLGLAIVKQLVEPQGGKVEVNSTVNVGTTFSFVLDFKKTNAIPQQETETALELEEGIQHVRVLVVEDISLNQLLLKTLLDEFGFDMDIAENGKVAISLLEKNKYDIILMDLQMPEMNGFEATHYIRKHMNLQVPIIALTADVTTVDADKCKEVGMNDYISKPIDEQALYNKILKFLKIAANRPLPVRSQPTATASPQIRITDLSYLNRLTRNNAAQVNEMIEIYLVETPELVLAMKKAIVARDWERLQAAAHSIIPSFSMMGIDAVYTTLAKNLQEYAIALQKKAPEGDKPLPELNDMFTKLASICSQACVELKKSILSR